MSIHSKLSDVGIAIVAPGGYAPDEAAFIKTVENLQAQGCRLRNCYDPSAKYQRFGGTDQARLDQLHAAAQDPDVKIVLSLRGGYGMTRLLPDIDFDLLARSGKLFVGHSDFTALQMGLLARTGAVSFAGPMICDDFTRADVSDFTMRHFWDCISQPSHTIRAEVQGNPELELSGMLWGGNLSMLAHLVGTPYLPSIDKGILFIEDVNEHPYRVERMLMQMLHAGVLQGQQALLLGEFSSYRLVDYDNGYSFETMLEYIRQRSGIPVLTGLPFGHVKDKVTLAVGCNASLTSDKDSLTLQMNGYPHLPG
ncbi:muramoyltetrapeptide carboxypeptidase [Oxalobacteraceae bacterium R-40]|uniref:Muramoyltetrapeptide carboxypeptidase n=1 Tax=Keguizhuia sedimenti TaxID=3064264 RepID=A0ABU1BRA6_9BURK|nr:muramoyltetrapeptide carboxypeptidase [Oxalobacteraceae bacterium R-40]